MSGTRIKLAVAGLVLAAIAAFAGYQYTHSPDYVARQQLKQAAAAQTEGHLARAAELYGLVALADVDAAPAGFAGLLALLEPKGLLTQPATEAAGVLLQARHVHDARPRRVAAAPLLDAGWAVVEAHHGDDAAGAKAVLDAIAPLETDKARWATAAEPLLERIVAADPRNVEAASELAALLERRRDCGRCEALLAPHAEHLGQREGARILGQIYAGKGKLDESYRLLQPYTDERLKRFVAAEAEYRKTGESLEKAAIEELRKGKAPQSFYAAYDRADDTARREMVGSYVNDQLSRSAELKKATQVLRDSSAIVPAALDLGIVTVQRAQTLTDTAARNAQFEAAEKVFLAIRGMAGDSDGYRLYLGQVYYWLGKQDEGKRLFDELLKAHGRQYGVLLDVAGLLRSVGAVSDARALVEEAYAAAKNNDDKWNAAHMRSVMFVDTEDELAWLEKSDPSSGRIRASLHSARATVAERRGQRPLAKHEYELAVAEFAKLPESAAQLNSEGLIHLALYGMEGDPTNLNSGLGELDQALGLLPTDSTLLLNNIAAVGTAAAAALVGDSIDLPALRSSGDFSLLEYLHNDEAERDKLRAAMRDNDAVKKGLAYGEKAALLAPRNPQSYAFAAQVASLLEDAKALGTLADRIEAAHLDAQDGERSTRDLLEGKNLKPYLEAMASRNQEATALLQQQAVKRLPATWAVAAGRWIDAQAMLFSWGQPINAEELVSVARKARAARPSAGTHAQLVKALETRAASRLAKSHAAYAASLAKWGRVLDVSTLMVIHMDEDADFLKAALADPDVAEIMAMVRERDTRYPSKASTWAWMLFRNADAKQAESIAQRIRADQSYAPHVRLGLAFAPFHVESVTQRYFFVLATGAKADAQRVLDDARKAGVPLPELLGRRLKNV